MIIKMKNNLLTVTAIIVVLFSTAATSMAQQRKPDQKVRVVMVDDKGGKTAIDTVYNLNNIKDTIKFSGDQIYVYKDAKTGESKLVVTKGMHGRGKMSCEPGMEMRREIKVIRRDSLGAGDEKFEEFREMQAEGNRGSHTCMQRKEMMACCGEGRMAPGMHQGQGMTPPPADKNVVFYNISIDGVTVTVTAPKEKSKEVDLIINDIQKILNTGK
jgi:hypothetical protein